MKENKRIELIKKVSHRLLVALLIALLVLVVLLYLPFIIQGYAAIAPVVVLVGIVGGLLSISKRLKQLNDIDLYLLADSILYTMLTPLSGGLLALVIYLLFLSGLLEGTLFPNFIPDPTNRKDAIGIEKIFHMVGDSPEDYAKLMFWSFLAGFSEKFAFNIISSFEKKNDNPQN
jgi:hypothetical protein